MNNEKLFAKIIFLVSLIILIVTALAFIYINHLIRSISVVSRNSGYLESNKDIKIGVSKKIKIPILGYHNFVTSIDDVTDMSIEIDKFRSDLEYLRTNGYTAIFFQDLIDYVYDGVPLPEKPVLISLADGYLSNYTLAYPILKETNTKATIFIVGASMVGVNEINVPHFDFAQGREMLASGVIDIQSHSFDLHKKVDGGYERDGASKNITETFDKYHRLLEIDNEQMKAIFMKYFDRKPVVFMYPYGDADTISDELFERMGYKATVGSDSRGLEGYFIQEGNPYSLYGLITVTIYNDTDLENILANYY